uniref:thioredoxin-dependent peroxiredoxin n=1 Tax=Peronospora matthiolae TaxID=2874970 RepID=A0AAV1TKJ6_9STRA
MTGSLAIRKPAPEFTADAVVDGEFKKISLSDYRGKYVVLFFYPMDFTFVCPTEICAFSDRVEDFEQLNTQVIGASVDSKFSHLAWINTPRKKGGLGAMNIPLVADVTKELCTKYHVTVEDGDEVGVAFRGLFIIDKEGILRQITVNDLPIGRNVDEVLRLVEALQFHEEHGDVCPANWKKGSKAMTASPKESLQYFESLEEPSRKRKVAA